MIFGGGKKITERKMCVILSDTFLIFSLHIISETFLIPRINRKDAFINVQTSPCEVSVILVRL